jgi:hypothetical protein
LCKPDPFHPLFLARSGFPRLASHSKQLPFSAQLAMVHVWGQFNPLTAFMSKFGVKLGFADSMIFVIVP